MNNDKDNVIKVDFGTTEPNTVEIDEEREAEYQAYINMFLNIGQSTYEYAMFATRDEYINHMLELRDHLHPEETKAKNGIEVPEKKIILP